MKIRIHMRDPDAIDLHSIAKQVRREWADLLPRLGQDAFDALVTFQANAISEDVGRFFEYGETACIEFNLATDILVPSIVAPGECE